MNIWHVEFGHFLVITARMFMNIWQVDFGHFLIITARMFMNIGSYFWSFSSYYFKNVHV